MRCTTLIQLAAALCLVSCNGMFDGIYDTAPAQDIDAGHFVAIQSQPNRMTLNIDATDYSTWHYVSLRNKSVEERAIPLALSGEWDGRSGLTYNEVVGNRFTELSQVKADAQDEPEEWDFAIHHFDVKTNGGAAIETPYTSFDELHEAPLPVLTAPFTEDVWSTTQVIVDLTGMMGYHIGYQNSMVNTVMSGWVTMDFSTPPPTYATSGKVYLMRLNDGSIAALRLRNYMNERGVKGVLTIDIIYPYE